MHLTICRLTFDELATIVVKRETKDTALTLAGFPRLVVHCSFLTTFE